MARLDLACYRDLIKLRGHLACRRAELKMAPLRVGLVAPLPPQVGGVASFAGWLIEKENAIGCRYEPFDLWRPTDAEAGGRLSADSVLRQARLMLALARWLRTAPRLVHVCVSYTRTGVPRDLVIVALLRVTGRRVIAHVHGAALMEGADPLRALALRLTARLSVETVALAPSSRAALQRLGIEASVVFNPVRLEGPASPAARQGAVCRALFVGTYGRRKGAAELVEAIAQLRGEGVSIELDLAGKEEFRGEDAELRRLVRESGLTDFVRFHGVLEAPALRDLYESSHVFVLPSRSEGLPMALLEAMAFRLPVVATRVGGIPDVVEDGESGLLIQPARTGELTDALRRLTSDSRLRDRLGEQAQARVRELASADIVAERWRTIYSEHERELVRCA
jgi:glycosyltransferase involved in cell wall biosynthesis